MTSRSFGLADLAGLLIYCGSSYAGAAGTLLSDSIKSGLHLISRYGSVDLSRLYAGLRF